MSRGEAVRRDVQHERRVARMVALLDLLWKAEHESQPRRNAVRRELRRRRCLYREVQPS